MSAADFYVVFDLKTAKSTSKIWKMNAGKIWISARKWLRRLAMAYMLGFANAINQETKMMDDTGFKTEQILPEDKD
ncbi:hypothetical protein [Dyadobacter sp.]|uniref:hypothetical protein n=1 Tax=Dyadobacter sp. TaxID=1914288 RepID=UPI003F70F872